jgi:hypothetical protein
MAVSIDTVYQRVLALANKEQRGYVTPQEFNLLANQAQMTIFESYFFTKNQRERLEPDLQNNTETDISDLLMRKLEPFTSITDMTSGGSGQWSYPANVYQVGSIYHNSMVCDEVSTTEFQRYLYSQRHASLEPIFSQSSNINNNIVVMHEGSLVNSSVTFERIIKPTAVAWGYVVLSGKPLLNSDTTVDFLLHESEENTLVDMILEMAGIVVNKPGLVQIAAQRVSNEQQIQNV